MNKKPLDAKDLFKLYQNNPKDKIASKIDGSHVEVFLNEKKNRMTIIRDRIGLRPIYFSSKSGYIISSSAGAIIKSGLIKSEINEKTVGRYAVCNYKSNYGYESTFYNNISLIEPRSIVNINEDGLKKIKYWDWDSNQKFISSKDLYKENLYHNLIKSSIDKYYSALIGNEIAVALSGGIDSGTIAGFLHKISGKKVNAISLSYNEKTDFDESELIKCSVRDHVEDWVDLKLSPYDLLDDLSSLYQIFDIPIATVSIYGYHYMLKECSKRGLRYIFTGAGGDYLQFGNYPCFLYYFADLKMFDKELFDKEIRFWIKNHSNSLYPKNFQTVEDFFDKNIDFSFPGKLKEAENFLPTGNILDKDFYKFLRNVNSNTVESYGSYSRTYIVQELLYEAVAPGTLAEDVSDWQNGTSMISPFFSNDLIEFGWVIPPNEKIRNGVNKVHARESLKGVCSDEILNRIDKSGFNAPFDFWIRNQINEFVMDIFSSHSFQNRNIYDLKKFNSILNSHMDGSKNHMMLFWQALNLELWLQKWID